MTRITIRPKTTSWPCSLPMIGALAEISGSRPMKSAPTAMPQSEPSPATAAPIRSWSERARPKRPGWAVAVRDEDESEPATPA